MSAKIGGVALVIVAMMFVTIEVTLHVTNTMQGREYDLNHGILLIALIIGFTGLYMLNPRRTKDGGQFLVDSTIRIVQVIRQGRRKGDSVVAVLEDTTGQHATVTLPTLEAEVPIESNSELPKRRITDGVVSKTSHDGGTKNGAGN